MRDIRTLFEQEDEYYKPIRAGRFCNKNYIEYESNGDRKNILTKRIFIQNQTLLEGYDN